MNRKINIPRAFFKFIFTITPHCSFNTSYFIFIILQINEFGVNRMLFGNVFCNKYVLSMKIQPSKKYYDGFRIIMVISPGHFKQINNDISLFQWWFDFNAKLICNRKVYLLIGMRPIVYMPQSAYVQGIEYSNTICAVIQSCL